MESVAGSTEAHEPLFFEKTHREKSRKLPGCASAGVMAVGTWRRARSQSPGVRGAVTAGSWGPCVPEGAATEPPWSVERRPGVDACSGGPWVAAGQQLTEAAAASSEPGPTGLPAGGTRPALPRVACPVGPQAVRPGLCVHTPLTRHIPPPSARFPGRLRPASSGPTRKRTGQVRQRLRPRGAV